MNYFIYTSVIDSFSGECNSPRHCLNQRNFDPLKRLTFPIVSIDIDVAVEEVGEKGGGEGRGRGGGYKYGNEEIVYFV